ncbi:hypothetical protein [Pelagovum pacificum]|uniref:DUF885 domain-containing protein n=1 Tax=Pelagovum pacificum TaxID=2588711 RepID=A0A5C5GAM6_9RHOB|nr:hypothetical protein [Pelagovum pacificum]QQA41748.1 hypothetical protein I8N54_13125 [Pelagovum pacificum]TNY31022.1 hypothetical protein FHY64_18195 [Pelagovum pacificum]
MKIGQDLAEITAGIDRLYRTGLGGENFLQKEGLIPVAVAEVTPRPFRDWTEVQDSLAALRERIPAEAETTRRTGWLDEMSTSLASLSRLFAGEEQSFELRLKEQVRVDTTLIGDDILDTYRADLRDALDEMGFRNGDLAEDVARWEDSTAVPAEQVIPTLDTLEAEAQARSNGLIFDIGDDWIKCVGVRDVPFNAYCDYPGRQLLLNLGYRYTRFELKHLAAHEAFPGHLVHLARREALVADGRMPLDGAQVVTSTASSPLFEGIADNGMEMLGWIETPEDVAGLALMRLRSALRCNACWMTFAEGKSIDEAAAATAGPSFQEVDVMKHRLALVSHELRAPFLYAYWCGDDAVRRFLAATKDWDRKDVMAELYDHMHTPTTLLAAAA